MALRPTRSRPLKGLAVLALAPLALSACSAGSLGSSDDTADGKTAITLLIDNNPSNVAGAEAVADAFNASQTEAEVSVETRPGGGDGDNLVKTRLQTGTMDDVFIYNAGSLFQQIAPAANLVNLTGDDAVSAVDDSFTPQVSVGQDVYGVPFGTASGGGVLYNKKVYEQLGLQVPTTWADYVANSEKVKAAGIAPIVQTYQDTWTSQFLVLGDYHNVAAANPAFAEEYTANKAKFATDPAAVRGFEHLQEIHDKGLVNADFASTKLEDGVRMLADGTAATYPMFSSTIATLQQIAPDKVDDIGFFALPGDDAATNGLTVWYPNGTYIPKSTTGAKLDAAKQLLAFIASPAGCTALSGVTAPTGPYLVTGCELPADVPPVSTDVQTYFDDDAQSPALEYLSPVKGPNLEQITVEIGSGIRPAADGAALYDDDVEKQAQQLGLAGW